MSTEVAGGVVCSRGWCKYSRTLLVYKVIGEDKLRYEELQDVVLDVKLVMNN